MLSMLNTLLLLWVIVIKRQNIGVSKMKYIKLLAAVAHYIENYLWFLFWFLPFLLTFIYLNSKLFTAGNCGIIVGNTINALIAHYCNLRKCYKFFNGLPDLTILVFFIDAYA